MMVELRDVCKDYARGKQPVPVLKHVNLQVEDGEYIAIMGPSGSGKTTLMNLIGCLDQPTSGAYLLQDQDVSSMNENKLAEIRNKHIGFVFQSFYLLPKMSAVENVALPLLYAGVKPKERRERAKAALESVGLGERLNFLPNQLSGGQCQRVAIARAIVGNPSLLLADEPTGALDTASGNQIMDIFRSLADSGMTIIMITHEPSVAECADKTYHILDGELLDAAPSYDRHGRRGGAGFGMDEPAAPAAPNAPEKSESPKMPPLNPAPAAPEEPPASDLEPESDSGDDGFWDSFFAQNDFGQEDDA